MRSKYKAKRTKVDNIWFASKGEAERYLQLKLLQAAEVIWELELQPRFEIKINGILICNYVADFRYKEQTQKGTMVSIIEDYKGMKTPVFRLKEKMFRATYPGLILRLTGPGALNAKPKRKKRSK